MKTNDIVNDLIYSLLSNELFQTFALYALGLFCLTEATIKAKRLTERGDIYGK